MPASTTTSIASTSSSNSTVICSTATSCFDCTSLSFSCGWCETTSTCVDGFFWRPNDVNSVCAKNLGAYRYGQCYGKYQIFCIHSLFLSLSLTKLKN